VEIVTALITALTNADAAYMGGYLFVLTLLALMPIPRRTAWIILALSIILFFTAGFANGMVFDTVRSLYCLQDLASTVVIVSCFIYLLDRLRFNSWEKSKKIEQQNEALKSDKEKIDELLHSIGISEAKYRQLFDQSPIGILVTSREGKLLTANRALLDVLKYESVDAVNAAGLANLYADQKDRADIWEKLKNGPVSGYKTVFRRADSELIYVSIVGHLVYDKDADALLFEGTIEDITERTLAEKALRESKEFSHQLIAAMPDIVIRTDMQGTIIFVNDKGIESSGYAKEEIVGKNMLSFVAPEDLEKAVQNTILMIEQPLGPIEYHLLISNGRKLLYEVNGSVLKNEAGVPYGLVYVVRDTTERVQAAEALQKSKDRLRTIIDLTKASLVSVDTSGRLNYANDAMAEALGFKTSAEIIGRPYLHFIHPEDRQRVMSTYMRQVETGQPPSIIMEYRIVSTNGQVKWLSFLSTLTIKDGKCVGQYGVAQDITERKIAEESLRQIEDRLSKVIEITHASLISTDAIGRINYANDAMAEVLGYKTPAEIMGMSYLHFVHPDDRRMLLENFQKEVDTRQSAGIEEFRIIDAKGNIKWVNFLSSLLHKDGQLVGRMGVARDITEHKQAEEALRESKENYEFLVKNTNDIIWVFDLKTMVYTFCSNAIERLLGYTVEEAAGRKVEDVIAPEHRKALMKGFGKIVAGKNPSERIVMEVEHIAKDGRRVWMEISAVLKRDNLGNPVAFNGVTRDISERKKAEVELKEAKRAADAANQAKSIFLANMSHEIRTPMNAILGFAQLMQRDNNLSPTSHKHLNIINRSGEHLLALINNILEMSKIEAGRTTLVLKTLDLHSLLHDIETMFRIRTDAKKLRFLLEKIGEIPRWVISDEGKLRQVLINLLGNAVKFTDEGNITLRICSKAEKADSVILQFEVEDTGPGMSDEETGRLFQPFEQSQAGLKSGGTGLGLALSRGLVQIMGGSISVKSMPGKGTSFHFEIPVHEGKEEQIQSEIKRRVLGLKPDQGEIRVLIADDREANRQFLSQLLGPVGFKIQEAVNGEEAVRMVREWKPQVVLMDISMPVMDGYEATRIIKAAPELKNTAVIAVTASAFEEDRRKIFASGVDAYLSKPFKDAELFENIARLTGVDYLYKETDDSGKSQKTGDDTKAMQKIVEVLPSGLVSQIRNAVEAADIDRLNELVKQLATSQPKLAKWIQKMAFRYEYESLIELFSKGE